jgi:hypothetical protein
MRQELFTDIDPPIKQALQRRKRRVNKRKLYEYSKSAFIRVFPLSFLELAKENEYTTLEAAEKYVLGVQHTDPVRDPVSSYTKKYKGKDNTGAEITYGYNRPVPGITGLSVQYEGFSGKGLVKMQLKGVINTLEDLDIYKPVLFSPGKYWCLEWGYLPDTDKEFGDGITDNLITIENVTTLYETENIEGIFELVEDHRRTTKGTSEIQIAVVNNYEYTLNAAGSFEFVVDFMGNSTLFKNLQSGAVGSGFKSETATMTDADGNPLTEEQYKALMNMVASIEPKEFDAEAFKQDARAQAQTIIGDNLRVDVGIEGGMNLEIVEKFKASTSNDFFKNLKNYIIECYKSTGKDTTPEYTFGVNKSLKMQGVLPAEEAHGNSELNVKKYGMYYEAEKTAITQAGEKFDYNAFNNEIGPYVTWGWFEDNILNVVYSKNKDTSKPMKWESIDQDGIPLPLNSHKYLYTTTPDKLIIPGRMPDILEQKFAITEPSAFDAPIQRGDFVDVMVIQTGENLKKTGEQIGADLSAYKDKKQLGEEKSLKKHLKNRDMTVAERAGTAQFIADVDGSGDGTSYVTEVGGIENAINVHGIFGAYHPIVHDYLRISESAFGFDETYVRPEPKTRGEVVKDFDEDLYDVREQRAPTVPDIKGSIRRLVLHYKLIEESFIGAATPIEGLRTLINKIENMGYKGFWEFEIFEVDNKIGVYEKNSLPAVSEGVINVVRNQIIDSTIQNETPPFGEVFVFPTWNEAGGFVLNQNLTVKMPSGKMLAMVYGSSLEGRNAIQNKAMTDGTDPQLFSAISAGKTNPQKVKVEPAFQGSEIDVVKHIDKIGIKTTTRIAQKYITSKAKLQKSANKYQAVQYRFVGEKRVPIDGIDSNIFSKGISIDASGRMYENVEQVMNYRLQKSFEFKNGVYTKITGRDTRRLDIAELSIKIQGLSGLNWGNQFHTDYIEERFKAETVFYITKINHEINESNWTTEIVGNMLAVFKDDYIKSTVAITPAEDRYIDIQLSDADRKLISKMAEKHKDLLLNSGRMSLEMNIEGKQSGAGWYRSDDAGGLQAN